MSADGSPSTIQREFDYRTDPAFLADPFRGLDRARGQRAFWSTSSGGYWVLTRADDIRRALQSPETFSSETRAKAQDLSPSRAVGGDRKLIPTGVDPPQHGKYRRALARPFAPAAIEQMRQGITSEFGALVDSMAGKGRCEFVHEVAWIYPGTVFSKMMGLPPDGLDAFLRWEHDMLRGDADRMQEARSNAVGYLEELIDARIAQPTGDLISYIISASIDDRPFSREEVIDTCTLFFLAGLDTVTAALGLIFKHLAEEPRDRQNLTADLSRVPAAVEELLRLYSPVNPSRTVVRDVEFAGVEMKAGDLVLLATALSTRDPAEFTDAQLAVIDRPHNNHIAFGAGPHFCLGSHLARLELNIAVTEWLRRIPDFSLDPDADLRYHGGGVMGLDALHLTWPIA